MYKQFYFLLLFIPVFSIAQNKYEGEYENGKYSGYGTCYFNNGDSYIGEWKNGMCNGIGTYINKNGSRKTGHFKDGKFVEDFIISPPWHLVDVFYELNEVSNFKSLSIDVEISDSIPESTALYIAPFGIGKINNHDFYGGIQTQADGFLDKPYHKSTEAISKLGRGIIFSRWDQRSTEAIQLAPNGYAASNDDEGDFISVRNKFHWGKGKYCLTLFTTDKKVLVNDTICTFVGMKIYSYRNKISKLAGYLAFPGTALKLDKTLAIFVELYGDTASIANVPYCKIKLSNFILNQQKLKPKKVIAIYDRKYPQLANTTKNNESISIEIGKPFQRKNYYITESDCNLIFVR
jgi:hypothetical protein